MKRQSLEYLRRVNGFKKCNHENNDYLLNSTYQQNLRRTSLILSEHLWQGFMKRHRIEHIFSRTHRISQENPTCLFFESWKQGAHKFTLPHPAGGQGSHNLLGLVNFAKRTGFHLLSWVRSPDANLSSNNFFLWFVSNTIGPVQIWSHPGDAYYSSSWAPSSGSSRIKLCDRCP